MAEPAAEAAIVGEGWRFSAGVGVRLSRHEAGMITTHASRYYRPDATPGC